MGQRGKPGVLFSCALFLLLTACSSQTASCAPPMSEHKPEPYRPPAAAATAPITSARINATRAMQYLREIVGFGPRPVGSAGHKKLEAYLRTHLKSDKLEEDSFTAQTPLGALPMHNFIAKFPGSKDGIIVIAGHYDTLYSLKQFVGANDGGSSTALLLELANQFRGKQRSGYSVWLVWLDGEEAIRQWSETDSLYGSRHLAEKWQKDGTLGKIKAFVLADMIGDADLHIERDASATAWLVQLVADAATRLGYQSHFFRRSMEIEDDHKPFLQRGVPAIDLIDFEYGYDNALWHTLGDTLDRVSPKSLEIVGSVVLETIQLLDGR